MAKLGGIVRLAGKAVMLRIVKERRGRMAARLARLDEAQRRAVEAAISALEPLPDWRSAFEIETERTSGPGEEDHERPEAQSA